MNKFRLHYRGRREVEQRIKKFKAIEQENKEKENKETTEASKSSTPQIEEGQQSTKSQSVKEKSDVEKNTNKTEVNEKWQKIKQDLQKKLSKNAFFTLTTIVYLLSSGTCSF